MDFAYISPSRVKALLVPINGCTRAEFDYHTNLLYNEGSEIRLLDLSPKSQLHILNPQSFPQGYLRYDFQTSTTDNDSIFLYDFEPYRKSFVVIGIGKYSQDSPLTEIYQKQQEKLASFFPTAIVHNIILFDTPSNQCPSAADHSSKTCFYHNLESGAHNTQSIMCGISENFLVALENYASSYSNITLRSPVSINNSSQMLPMTIAKAQKRILSGFKINNNNSASTSPNVNVSTGGGIISDKSKLQQRQTGRQAKLMGNFCLLAGQHSEALNYFNEACILLKKCDDFLWLASTLEGISICILLLQLSGTQYQLPTVLLYAILQIPKVKLSNNIVGNSTNGSDDGLHHKRNGSVTRLSGDFKRNSVHSPRNSSTFVSFQSQTELELGLTTPEVMKYISQKVFQYFSFSMNDFENMVPDYVYVDTMIRYIKFMVYVYQDRDTLGLVSNHPPLRSQDSPQFHQLIFSKSEIIAQLDKVFQTQISNMSSQQQFKIYCAMSNIYHELELERKRAFILRLILVEILPKLKQAQEENKDSHLLTDEYFDNSFGFRDIIKSLFEVYDTGEPTWTHLQIPLLKLCLEISELVMDWLNSIKICLILLSKYLHCLEDAEQIWIKDKFDHLVNYSRINNLAIKTNYWDPFLVRGVNFIIKNQEDLIPFNEYSSTPSAESSSNKKPFIFNPYKNNSSNKNEFKKDKIVLVEDTYQLRVKLQNPFAFEIEINEIEIVTDEGSVKVETLKNLIRPVAIIITPTVSSHNAHQTGNNFSNGNGGLSAPASSLKRVTPSKFSNSNSRGRSPTPTSGSTANNGQNGSSASLINSSSVSSVGNQLVIGPKSTRDYFISFKALSVGDLKITGFRASLCNCNTQIFKIIETEDIARVYSTLETETFYIHLTVIKQQPTLSLTNILVNNGWLMLLQGEKYKFSIQLTNQSSELINYLSFSFWDSTIDSLNHRLSNISNSTPASEIYELEWYLLKFKPFKILNKKHIAEKFKQILPESKITIEYEITGKRGMKELKMILEYSSKEKNEGIGLFIKNVHVPIQMTVVPLIEIIGCEILPIIGTSMTSFKTKLNLEEIDSISKLLSFLDEIFAHGKAQDYCLLVIDLKNAWNERLWIELNEENIDYPVNEVIESKKCTRVFLPIKKISGITNDLTKQIPSLMKKQFIKNYLMSEQKDLEMKQLFWLREIVLERLRGSWWTSKKERFGIIDLRSISITRKMANIITMPKILISQVVVQDSDSQVVPNEGAGYSIEIDEFYVLETKITNDSLDDFRCYIRHIPNVMDLSNSNNHNHMRSGNILDKNILINGVLQHSIGIIPRGETVVVKLSFTVIERGTYEWGTIVEEMGGEKVIASEPLIILA